MLVDAIKTTPNDPLLWKLAAKLEKLGVLNAHSRRISRKYLIKQAGLFFGRRFIDGNITLYKSFLFLFFMFFL